MKNLLVLLIITTVILTSGCGVEQEYPKTYVNVVSPTAIVAVTPTESSAESASPTAFTTVTPTGESQSANEFSVFLNDKYITLEDWDKDNYIISIFGKPNKESVEVLGAGADIFVGSKIKTLEYEGLTIKLFIGKDYFWIVRVEITDKMYETYRGMSVGKSVNDLKEKYDNVTQALDGRTDVNNCGYTINDQDRFIWFEVENGVIKAIKYYLERG